METSHCHGTTACRVWKQDVSARKLLHCVKQPEQSLLGNELRGQFNWLVLFKTIAFSHVSLAAVKAEGVWRGVSQVAAGVIVWGYLCTSLVSRCSANWGLSGVSGKSTWGLCCVDIPWWSCLLGLRKQESNFSGSHYSPQSCSASWISHPPRFSPTFCWNRWSLFY